MAPYLGIFGLTVQAYALLLLLAVWTGLWLSAREARRLGLDGDHVYNMGFYALLATLIGARLVYVLSHWSAYRGALLSALSPTPTALAWPEGALVGGVVVLIYWTRYRLPAGATLDAIALGLVLARALERLGAFLGGRSYGEPTSVPWAVSMWGEMRHPVQLYEMAALLVILGVLWWRPFDKLNAKPFDGYSFTLLVVMYGGVRLFLEAFRADAPLMDGGVRAIQVVALAAMLGAVWYLARRRFSPAEGASDVLKGPG
jgi:prolipoprotein diacylglyceryl transferase